MTPAELRSMSDEEIEEVLQLAREGGRPELEQLKYSVITLPLRHKAKDCLSHDPRNREGEHYHTGTTCPFFRELRGGDRDASV